MNERRIDESQEEERWQIAIGKCNRQSEAGAERGLLVFVAEKQVVEEASLANEGQFTARSCRIPRSFWKNPLAATGREWYKITRHASGHEKDLADQNGPTVRKPISGAGLLHTTCRDCHLRPSSSVV
jgi:hypothetical protein